MHLNHIGWVTQDIEAFESFWCNLLGWRCIYTSRGTEEMMGQLFQAGPAIIKRYSKEGSLDLEIHYFLETERTDSLDFQRQGINHVCLFTGGKGSRQELLNKLPEGVSRIVYDNPGGWQNIFIRDYENNWVELREDLS